MTDYIDLQFRNKVSYSINCHCLLISSILSSIDLSSNNSQISHFLKFLSLILSYQQELRNRLYDITMNELNYRQRDVKMR